MASNAFRLAVGLLFAAMVNQAAAAPEEIQVYTDDLNERGEFSLELHTNFVIEGPRDPDYPGQLPTHHVLQVTPEFSYGLGGNFDVGFYLLTARGRDGNLYVNGAKPRIKYLSKSDSGFFWGLNMEIGYTSQRVSEVRYNMEVRPIIGWRDDKWLAAFNPIFGAALSGDVSHKPSFEPAVKVSRTISEGVQVGLEHYADIGPINESPAFNQQNHMLFAALDVQKGPLDVNFGIGRGLTSASESWVVKMIVGIPLK